MEESPNKEWGLLIRGPCDESEADDAERPMQGTAASVNPFLFLLVDVAVPWLSVLKARCGTLEMMIRPRLRARLR